MEIRYIPLRIQWLPDITLEPLSLDHVPALRDACKDTADGRSIWRYLFDQKSFRDLGMQGLVEQLIAKAQSENASPKELPYAVVKSDDRKAIGCTRYLDIQPLNHALEIATWFGHAFQGKREDNKPTYNIQSKYLLLDHAFSCGCDRVQFKIDHRNFGSIDAIERIRAFREGTLRNHVRLVDEQGRDDVRSSAIYSILRSEWPAVKLYFETKLLSHANEP